MIIAIPTEGDQGIEEKVSEHFGRCNTYTLIDDKGNLLQVIPNTSSHKGGKDLPPEFLQTHHINVLLCKGLGPRALASCKRLQIAVYVCSANTVKEMIEKWKNQTLSLATIDDTCKDHCL